MPASRKPRRPYNPRRQACKAKRPDLYETHVVFAPIERLFRQLETGLVDSVGGYPVMTEKHGALVEIAPALDGWCGLWERIGRAERLQVDVEPVRKIARKLRAVTPLTEDEVKAGKSAMDICHQLFLRLPSAVIRKHAQAEEIAINLERAAA